MYLVTIAARSELYRAELVLICILDRYVNLVLDLLCNANTGCYMGIENGLCVVGHNGYLCKAEKNSDPEVMLAIAEGATTSQ